MKKSKVLILGASGMLGSMLADFLSRKENLSLTAAVRSPKLLDIFQKKISNVTWQIFEIKDEAKTIEQLENLPEPDWIINAIGIIKPYLHDDKPEEVERGIIGNSCFPFWLARTFKKSRILQIATDCVYSGQKGQYVESDKHDAIDVYGKTKSLGEVQLPNVNLLRCSIIGPEVKSYVSLLEWFLRQPANAKVTGFTNHSWNGVTTLHFAKICCGIISNNLSLPNLSHIVPHGDITKHDLLCSFAESFNRKDIKISAANAQYMIDRRLATEKQEINAELWKNAGYEARPPSVCEMVGELVMYDFRFRGMEE
ncbi:MAG: sugar nucleotide-binding protein [Sedimentisphaerales bacterium]|nr:sugar nucleotide-binding protein [Sedimentisphaerales bacterium]